MTEHIIGQIAEYGTDEFNNNKSVYTVLYTATYLNLHNIKHPMVFYHRTEGYKPAGSCATWCKEILGYSIFHEDSTNHGKYWTDENTARDYWNNINKIDIP